MVYKKQEMPEFAQRYLAKAEVLRKRQGGAPPKKASRSQPSKSGKRA